MTFRPGDTIDAWVVERSLGAGGMGSVYLCRNRAARRILAAVKVLDARLGNHPTVRARFVREAELLFSLDHPNIVKVRNLRMDASPPYLEMEFVSGRSLDGLLEAGPLPPGDAVHVARQVAEALAYVHARGVYHRDVKPGNVLVQPDGVAKLVDFGIASETGSHTMSEAGQAIGSAAYVPPEALGGGVDPARWDLYGLGVALYELLTGQNAFPVPGGGTALQHFVATMRAKEGQGPLDPPRAPETLRALVRHLTDPDPARGARSAAEAVEALRALDLPVDPAFAERLAMPAEPAPAEHGSVSATWSGTDLPEPADAQAPVPPTMPAPTVPAPTLPTTRAAARPVHPPPLGAASPAPVASTPDSAPARPGRSSRTLLAGVLVLAAGALLWRTFAPAPEASTRPLVLELTPAEAAIFVRLDDAPVAVAMKPGGVAQVELAGAAVGEHRLEVRRGAGCEASSPAVTCGVLAETVRVPAGAGAHRQTVTLPAMPHRDVVVTDTAGGLLSLWVEGGAAPGKPAGAASVTLTPGSYRAAAAGEGCPPPPCGKSCPPACATWEGSLEVPWGEGAWTTTLTLARRAPGASAGSSAAETASSKTTAAATPAADAGRAARSGPSAPRPAAPAVSIAQLAAWLGTHPDWQPEAARNAGRADEIYLAGWVGATPPAGSGGPAQATSPELAQAYCKSRGGLARVDAAPTSWTDLSSAAWHEWRRDESGQPVSLQSSGNASPPVGARRTGKFTGFRCAGP